MARQRTIPGNARQVVTTEHPADAYSVGLAGSLAMAIGTDSPMSGRNQAWGGDPGYGVNRDSGEVTQIQAFLGAAAATINSGRGALVGMQAGPSGQPAYPSTGAEGQAYSPVAMLDMGRLGYVGMGG